MLHPVCNVSTGFLFQVFALMFFSKSAAAGVAFGYSHSFPLVPLVAMLACIAVPAGISFTVCSRPWGVLCV